MNTPATGLTLTDEQWDHIVRAHPDRLEEFVPTGATALAWLLVDAAGALRVGELAMPQVGEIALWDTSDADGHDDLVLTVQISDDLRVATSPIEISAFRADIPEGPAAARFALEKILSLRNDLVQALTGYTATGMIGGPAPKDAAILGGVLICPHCTASDRIVEIDFDTRRNPVAAIDADAVGVHQGSSNYATVRFECSACGGEVTIPFDVTY